MPSGKKNRYEKGYFNAFDSEYNSDKMWNFGNRPEVEAKKAKQIAKKKKRKK